MTVFYNAVMGLGRLRLSKFANKLTTGADSETEDDTSLEDVVERVIQTRLKYELSVEGWAEAQAEAELIQSYTDDALRLPFTAVFGDRQEYALLAQVRVGSLAWDLQSAKRGRYTAKLIVEDEIHLGKTLISPLDGEITAAALGARRAEMLPMIEGHEAILTLHALTPPGVLGTTPQFEAQFESHVTADPWIGAVPRAVADPITEPGAAYITLDGDATPITDTHWALHVTTVSGTDASATFLAAVAVIQKLETLR